MSIALSPGRRHGEPDGWDWRTVSGFMIHTEAAGGKCLRESPSSRHPEAARGVPRNPSSRQTGGATSNDRREQCVWPVV
jgi:hypothetical protein